MNGTQLTCLQLTETFRTHGNNLTMIEKIINKQAAKLVLEYVITLRLKGFPMLELYDAVDDADWSSGRLMTLQVKLSSSFIFSSQTLILLLIIFINHVTIHVMGHT